MGDLSASVPDHCLSFLLFVQVVEPTQPAIGLIQKILTFKPVPLGL